MYLSLHSNKRFFSPLVIVVYSKIMLPLSWMMILQNNFTSKTFLQFENGALNTKYIVLSIKEHTIFKLTKIYFK